MAIRYVGNTKKKEFHQAREAKQTEDCQIPEIRKRIVFESGKQAIAHGYDPCAYCCQHWKSKR